MINVKETTEHILATIKERNLSRGLAVITIGNDPASAAYVKGKRADCEKCGFQFRQYAFSTNTPRRAVEKVIQDLNFDESVTGIIVQLPVPTQFLGIEEKIYFNKDVDGFGIDSPFLPCTPEGVLVLLDKELNGGTGEMDFSGKHIVIIGRGKLVGEPLSKILLGNNATVTVCHSHTANLAELTRCADAVVAATGHRLDLTSADFRLDAVLIDCGIHYDENGKIQGDFAPNLVERQTPVPGGVGLMTRAMLMCHVAGEAGIYDS